MRPGLALALVLGVLGAWHLALRGHGRGVPLITDEGEYAAAARAWSDGGLPYRDAFSQKPPMTLLLYRTAAKLSPDPEAPRSLGALTALATLLALWLLVPRSWSLAGRLAAPAAFAALAALPVGDYGFTANTEVFVNLFATAAAALLLRGMPMAAGLAAGAALASKQTFAWTLLLFAGLAACSRGGPMLLRAAAFAAGAAVIPAAWAAYFFWRGAFVDYWTSAWAGNARYAAALVMTDSLSGQLAWFARTLAPRLALFSLPALACAGWALRGLRAGPERPAETLAVLWFGGACAGALTGFFLFPHYFLQLAPPLALAAACGVERLGGRRAWAAAAALALWPALCAPRLIFGADARTRALALLYPNPLFEAKALGQELRRRAAPGDRLHVFGSEGALFSYSGLRPATPHTLCYALTLFPANRAEIDRELARLSAAPPRFIVWSTQPLSTLMASRLGESYRDEMLRVLGRGYDYAGRVAVTDSPALPVFQAAGRGARAPFDAGDALLLFERR